MKKMPIKFSAAISEQGLKLEEMCFSSFEILALTADTLAGLYRSSYTEPYPELPKDRAKARKALEKGYAQYKKEGDRIMMEYQKLLGMLDRFDKTP